MKSEVTAKVARTLIWSADDHAQSDTLLAATRQNENVPKKDLNPQLSHAGETTVLSPRGSLYIACGNRC